MLKTVSLKKKEQYHWGCSKPQREEVPPVWVGEGSHPPPAKSLVWCCEEPHSRVSRAFPVMEGDINKAEEHAEASDVASPCLALGYKGR